MGWVGLVSYGARLLSTFLLAAMALAALGAACSDKKRGPRDAEPPASSTGTGGEGTMGSTASEGSGGVPSASVDTGTGGSAGASGEGGQAPDEPSCEPGEFLDGSGGDSACRACDVGTYCDGLDWPVECGEFPNGHDDWDHDADPATPCVSWQACSGAGPCNAGDHCEERTAGIGTATEDALCYGAGWKLAWSTWLDPHLYAQFHHASGDVMVSGNNAYRLAGDDGSMVWKVDLNEACDAPAALMPDGNVVIASNLEAPRCDDFRVPSGFLTDNVVTKVAWESGEVLWQTPLAEPGHLHRVASDAEGNVLVESSNAGVVVVETLSQDGELLDSVEGAIPVAEPEPLTRAQRDAADDFVREVVNPFIRKELNPSSFRDSGRQLASDGTVVGYQWVYYNENYASESLIAWRLSTDPLGGSMRHFGTYFDEPLRVPVFGKDERILLVRWPYFGRENGDERNWVELWLPIETE